MLYLGHRSDMFVYAALGFYFSLFLAEYVIVSWNGLPQHHCSEAVIRPDMSIDQIPFYMYYKKAVMQSPLQL